MYCTKWIKFEKYEILQLVWMCVLIIECFEADEVDGQYSMRANNIKNMERSAR